MNSCRPTRHFATRMMISAFLIGSSGVLPGSRRGSWLTERCARASWWTRISRWRAHSAGSGDQYRGGSHSEHHAASACPSFSRPRRSASPAAKLALALLISNEGCPGTSAPRPPWGCEQWGVRSRPPPFSAAWRLRRRAACSSTPGEFVHWENSEPDGACRSQLHHQDGGALVVGLRYGWMIRCRCSRAMHCRKAATDASWRSCRRAGRDPGAWRADYTLPPSSWPMAVKARRPSNARTLPCIGPRR